ncbi:MAG TPA: glycoside hydrolase family 172 protein [Polyangia bacterium]|nr:glycoside hydrolase family 172 protein [Polyangia bacterium]
MRRTGIVVGLAAAAGLAGLVRTGACGAGRDGASPPAPASPPEVPALAAVPPPGPEPVAAPGEISVLTLLREMVDLDHLARLPALRFVAGQAASTDRRSRRPDDADGWFANDDFVTDAAPNLVRVETAPDGTKRYVLLDVKGPGAVVRIWSATPAGTLRIYVDGDSQPVVEAPFAGLLRGEVAPFVAPLAHVTARGYNLYFPIPYRSGCLVTVDSIVALDPFNGQPTAKLYYQIGYRTYPATAAANVRPYAPAEVSRAQGALGRVAAVLRDGLPPAGPRYGRSVVELPPAAIAPGHPATMTLAAPAGGGQLTELRLTTAERAPDRLAAATLSIAFDGEETVRAPLLAFFGTGGGWNAFTSLPMTVAADGTLTARFPMPFARRAVVTIASDAAGLTLKGSAVVDARPFGRDALLFHAGWRPRAVLATRPFRDWHIATLQGVGQQVGTVLNVQNPPSVAWWGEGDEKIFVDGESFPSLLGTGTEDYFGYAWSTPDLFAHAYHAQTAAPAQGFGGFFSMNRFLVLDPIPFARALRFDLEIWHWSDTSIAADALLYWYARPGARDDFARPAP